MKSLFALLSRRADFRRLWLGETLSLVGDWLSYVAVSLLALKSGDGVWALAVVFAAHVLPAALVAPWAGALADRIDRRTILVTTQVVMSALMVAMVFAAAHGALLAVEIILFTRTAVGGFFYPAKQAAMRELVTDDELVDANAIDTATWSLSFTFGTALGGVIAMAGPVVALSIDAVTFALAALVFARLPALPAAVRERTQSSVKEMWSAFSHAWRTPDLLEATLSKAPVAFAGGAAWILLNITADSLANSGTLIASTALALGLLQATRGVGTGVGPVLAKRLIAYGHSPLKLLRLSCLLCFAALAAFSFASGWLTTLVCVALWGVGSGGYWVFSSAELQRLAPRTMLGRLAAIDQLAMTFGMSLAALTSAWVADLASTPRAAAWFGLAVGLLLYAGLRLRAAARPSRRPCIVTP